MRIVNTDQPALKNEQGPVIGAGLQRQKKQKGQENQGNAETAPYSQDIAVKFVPLIDHGIEGGKKAVNQTVDDPKHKQFPDICVCLLYKPDEAGLKGAERTNAANT